MGSDNLFDTLASICDEQADLYLRWPSDGLSPDERMASDLPCAVDARAWKEAFGDTDPAGALSRIVLGYLSEASHQLRAMGVLLQKWKSHATLEPLVRAILERCGRTCWLLDEAASADQRAGRTQLELGVGALHYADMLDLSDAPNETRAEHRKWRSDQRARIHTHYDAETNGSKKDVGRWTINGESYKSYPSTVSYALDGHRLAPAVYAELSGLSHPNAFFFGVRARQSVEATHASIVHGDAVERTFRIALDAHLNSVSLATRYYSGPSEATAVAAAADQLAQRLDDVSTLDSAGGAEAT